MRRECCYLIIPTQSNTALGGDSMWVWVPSVRKGQVRTNIYIATSSHIKDREFKNMEDENSELPLKRTLWWINPIFGGYCQLLSQPGSQTGAIINLRVLPDLEEALSDWWDKSKAVEVWQIKDYQDLHVTLESTVLRCSCLLYLHLFSVVFIVCILAS